MKLFVSYSGDVRDRAEKLVARLRARMYEVFFDRTSLLAGEEFAERIKREVMTCDIFVFLISAESVSEGRFTLTELRYAEERWSNPSGRVLPVLASEADWAGIPAYLTETVSVLRTRGDFVVDVCDAVDRLANARKCAVPGDARILDLTNDLIEKVSQRRRVPPRDASLYLVDEIEALVRSIRSGFAAGESSIVAGARLLKVIGVGNFGVVWEGLDLNTGMPVAVKAFRLERLTEGQMLARFRRSVRAMRLLSERKRLEKAGDRVGRVVRFVAKDPTELAFSMELLSGGNLEDVARFSWTLERKLEVLLAVCAAVAYSHSNGVIHRDVKPANVVLDDMQEAVLTDFDISDIRWATSLSTMAEGLGTPIFAAPEQIVDADAATEASDIYSLGRLLHYLLLERSPGVQLETDPSLVNLSSFPPGLVEIVRRATQGDPRRRFSTVNEMARAIERSRTGSAAWRARLKRTLRWGRKNWATVSLGGIALLASTGFSLYQGRVATVEKVLRLEADQQRHLAEEHKRQLEKAQEELEQLSQRLAEMRGEDRDISRRRQQIVMQLAALETERGLSTSDKQRAELNELFTQRQQDLAQVDQALASLNEEQIKLEKALSRARSNATEPNCRTDPACTMRGRCTLRDGECVASSDSDCQQSRACSANGECNHIGDWCVAGGHPSRPHPAAAAYDPDAFDALCGSSASCKVDGLCFQEDGRCVAKSNSTCRISSVCTHKGACSMRNGKCVAASEDDCLGSTACIVNGKCAIRNGECAATSEASCRRSATCEEEGKCTARGSECVAASEVDCQHSVLCKVRDKCKLLGDHCG